MSLTSPIVIKVPSRAPLAVETKSLFIMWLANLNNKSNVCKQISSTWSVSDKITPSAIKGLLKTKRSSCLKELDEVSVDGSLISVFVGEN